MAVSRVRLGRPLQAMEAGARLESGRLVHSLPSTGGAKPSLAICLPAKRGPTACAAQPRSEAFSRLEATRASLGVAHRASCLAAGGAPIQQSRWTASASGGAVALGDGGSVGNDGGGGAGRRGGGGGGAGGAGDGSAGEGSEDREEYGRTLSGDEVNAILANEGVRLPEDMAAAAQLEGLPEKILQRFVTFQTAAGPAGRLFRASTAVRNRLLADEKFLFKVFTEVAVDTGCATVAEVQKRGKDFWAEFELYMSDLLVGLALDVALVGMLAPVAAFAIPGGAPTTGLTAALRSSLAALPSSMFEAAGPGRSFSAGQRVACYLVKGGQYAAVGTACGLVGQGIANAIMTIKRHLKPSDESEQVKVPPLIKSAALWGVFMGVSSNTRYQVINGLERLVEHSPITRKFPLASNTFTVAIRFGNNVFGGMQFVDWARMAGVQ